MIVAGLTGSIGMGKSTTAAMFAEAGIPVWDADRTVHALYGPGGAGAAAIARLHHVAATADGVDRAALRAAILQEPDLLKRIEAVIHPLVAENRNHFLADARAQGHALALCDIPLLFETGAEKWLDTVIVVTADADIQRRRVLERPGMTEEVLAAILAKQIPDAEKRRNADHLIDTGFGMDHARNRVQEIIAILTGERDA